MRAGRWVGLAGLFFITLVSGAQAIRGRVLDVTTGEPLFGATIRITETELGSVTDTAGYYQVLLPNAGVFSVSISYLGYQEVLYPEVWVKNQGTASLDVSLNPSFSDLEAVTITERREVSTPGRLVITEEQISRFASTYYDPARMAATVPDVAVTNDQNNRISVRGIPPAYNIWRLEGTEILNPNHLSNAGTFSDQPTSSGGGVNILSAQMMSNSSFLYGHMTSGYSNTVGGLFDMQMKVGNEEETQYVAQASFIGFDFAADGPLSKTSKATFAMNYRYSFTGLLAAFRVDFGGERIGFQDLSFSMNFPVGSRFGIKVFGVGGLNYNHFAGAGRAQAETEKDLYLIDFTNATGIVGARFTWNLSSLNLKNTICFSGLKTNRRQQSLADETDINSVNQKNLLISDHFLIQPKDENWTAGVIANGYFIHDRKYVSYQYPQFGFSYEFSERFANLMVSPYFSKELSKDENTYSLGVSFPSLNGKPSTPDFRASAAYPEGNGRMTFSIGHYSQIRTPYNGDFNQDAIQSPAEYPYPQKSIRLAPYRPMKDDFIKSYRAIFDYRASKSSKEIFWSFFYYFFPQVEYSEAINSQQFRQNNAGVVGCSTAMERLFNNKFYYRVGGSLYSPKAGQNQSQFYDMHFNGTGSIGNKWELDGDRTFQLSFRTILNLGSNFDYELTDVVYQRFDIRMQWTKVKGNTIRNLSLDIQNFTSIKNVSGYYYDTVLREDVVQYQLGLIPILTYRVDF